MAERKVREFLTGSGIKDDEITYNNGRVMVKGRDFMGATPRADGSTYGDENQLNQAFNNYNFKDAMNTYQTNLAKPREQFSYDAQADPLYQNALGVAQRSAQTAGNNASVRLGARGIGNSQQALTTENQIQQRAVADVNSNILPQLMNQAYSRYNDELNRDERSNAQRLQLAGMYNDLGQQQFNNDRTLEQEAARKRQEHLDLANALSQQYGVNVDPKDDPYYAYKQVEGLTPIATTKYNDGLKQQGIENTRADKQLNATLSNMSSDNARATASEARQAGNQQLANLYDIWDRTGVAPAGIPGVQEGKLLQAKPSTTSQTPETIDDYAKKYLDGLVKYDNFGKLVNGDAIESQILLSGKPENEMQKLYARYGLKWGG